MNKQPLKMIAYNQPVKQPMPPKRRSKKPRIPFMLIGGFVSVGAVMVMCMMGLLVFFIMSEPTIAQGVTVADIAVGGKTADEAKTELEQTFASRTIRATANETTVDVPLRDLGITLDAETTIARARAAQSGESITPVYSVDMVQAQNGFLTISDSVNVAAVAEPPQVGHSLEIPVMLSRLRTDTAGEIADGVLDLTMIEIAPPEPEPVTSENYTGATTTHVVEQGQELGLIARQYDVSVADIVTLNGIENPDLLYVGQELTIPAAGEYQPSQADAPAPSTNTGRAIVVSISSQRIFAYENGTLVHSHLASTGLPQTPTVLGDYSVYVKYQADDMSGPDYFLPQVPYTMYFYQGYAIHGTYWHNAFGRQMSHGCVNLPVNEAEWFFNFASVGTPVRVVN